MISVSEKLEKNRNCRYNHFKNTVSLTCIFQMCTQHSWPRSRCQTHEYSPSIWSARTSLRSSSCTAVRKTTRSVTWSSCFIENVSHMIVMLQWDCKSHASSWRFNRNICSPRFFIVMIFFCFSRNFIDSFLYIMHNI